MAKKKRWIQSAVKHPGAFTAQANAAGKSVHQFAEEHRHDSGTTGRRARLALTFEGMHGGGKKRLRDHYKKKA